MTRTLIAGIVSAFLAAVWIALWRQAYPCPEPRRPIRTAVLLSAANVWDFLQGNRRRPKSFADLRKLGLLPDVANGWNREGEPPVAGLREALDRAASLIETSSKPSNADYRAGWVDALRAVRDDPALASPAPVPADGLDTERLAKALNAYWEKRRGPLTNIEIQNIREYAAALSELPE